MWFNRICGFVLIALLGITGCKIRGNESANAEKPPMVEVLKVSSMEVRKSLSFSGNIEGNTTVRLGFMVAGKINFIAAEEGDSLRAGELLASIDPESYQIAKVMADAQVDQLQDDYDRLKELYNRNSLSESDLVKITMSLRAAKAQQRLQAKNLRDSKLYSPIDGILIRKGVEEGEIIDKGLQLFAVSDISKVKVLGAIPEMELRYMSVGSDAFVYVASVDSTFTGQIVEIGALADPATRTFSVKIELDNSGLLLRPGMTAEIQIETDKETFHIAIPAACILRDSDNSSFVFVVDTVKNKAFKRLVSVGRIIGNQIEITSGLLPNDLVITTGMSKLNNGSSVTLNNPG